MSNNSQKNVKVDTSKVVDSKIVIPDKLEFTRKIDSGSMIMSIQRDLIRVNDFAMAQERPTTYVLSDFSIQLKAVVSQESDKTMLILPSKLGEIDPNLMSQVNINLRPIPLEAKPRSSIKPVEAIEGVGVAIGGKLREMGITSVSDLALASASDVAKVGVSVKKANEFIGMAKLMTKSALAGVEGIDEQVAELLVVGAKIDSKEKLAETDPATLLKSLSDSVATGKVKVPKKTSIQQDDVTRWVSSAKTIVERSRLERM
jgi:hypothetical protein